jgi:hypothetical protein
MVDKATCLRFYKKDFVQKAIVRLAKDKEVAVKYGDKGFGKRPDVINYPSDVWEFAKQGVTSFHISEEHWHYPMHLKTGMTKKKQDELRKGWDLIIDIDSKHWGISRVATWIICQALKDEGFESISVKFSGNKGFHIGIPYESFSGVAKDIEKSFPELPRDIAKLLLKVLDEKYISVKDDKIFFGDKVSIRIETLKGIMADEGRSDELVRYICRSCKDEKKETKTYVEFICAGCGYRKKDEQVEFLSCPKCKKIMERMIYKDKTCSCGKEEFEPKFNILSVIDIDTLLISSRHMYRCVYSLHEKSGLASVPVAVDDILKFDKKQAHPDAITEEKLIFLEKGNKTYEGISFIQIAMIKEEIIEEEKPIFEYEEISEAAPEELFPPCIKKMFKGIEDGRKRAMFVITNFLFSVGWNKDMITDKLKEWNQINTEPLSETLLLGHVRYHSAKRKKAVLPPNCDNKAYYKDMGICTSDQLCERIKNPVNYVRRRMLASNSNKNKQNEKNKSL